MTRDATFEPSTHSSETMTGLYPPSWVDRFIEWVKRLPVPSWLFYLLLWLALFLMANAVKWLDGSQPVGTIGPFYTVGASDGVYFLALMHYLLSKIPTWPWQPGTLRVALSPLLLPVAVWLIQRFLERVAGL
jgi:hypothetical protein